MTSAQLQNSPQISDVVPDFTAASLLSGESGMYCSPSLLSHSPEQHEGAGQAPDESRPVERLQAGNFARLWSPQRGLLLLQRAYFLIDSDGRLRWSHVESTTVSGGENSELLAAIKLLS
ncbi:MAG TPA: hypothetical protein VGJ62_12910 [Gemmatimonadaceae bacterium]|jgi:hypothetical protein